MLTDQALNEMFESYNTPHAGRERIKAIRTGLAARQAAGRSVSVKIRYCSVKMGFVIDLEASHTEYPAAVSWEYDDETLEYYPQPTKLLIKWTGAKGRCYAHYITPDFLQIHRSGFQFVECKLEKDLLELGQKYPNRFYLDADGNWRSPPAEAAAAELGCKFVLRSSVHNNWVLVENLEFLRDYLISHYEVGKERLERIRSIFAERPWISIDELLHSEYRINADDLYAAIVQNQVYFELTRDRLTQSSEVGVYRDRDAAVAYSLFVQSKLEARFSNAHLSLMPGTRFEWDGHSWEVLNLGEKSVAARQISSSDPLAAPIIDLPHEQLSVLAKAGKIRPIGGVSEKDASSWDVLARYHPQELQIAVWRHQILFGTPSKDNPLKSRSKRTQQYWLADWRKSELVNGYGFAGLIPNGDKTQGNKLRKLDEKVIELMHEIIDTQWPDPRQATPTAMFGTLQSRCAELGLTPPSRKTFNRVLKGRIDSKKAVARLGARMAYEDESILHWWLEYTTPIHGTHPFHIAHIDSTPLDIKLRDRSLKRLVKSLWLTLLIDAFTRKVLAFYLTFDKPSYRSSMMVIRDCVKRHGRLPQFIVSDQGQEFNSTYYEVLLGKFYIHKKERPASKPRAGSLIERLFNTTREAFINNLLGNTQAERNWRMVSPSVNPIKFAIWTYERLAARLEEYFEKVYHANFHTTLGCSPQEKNIEGITQSGARLHCLIPYTREFLILTMPGTRKGEATITNRGVKILYRYHSAPVLADLSLRGKSVPVRYDPHDLGTAMVYVRGRWEEVISEYHALFKNYTEKQIIIASEFLRLQDREAGKQTEMNAKRLAEFLVSTKADEVLALQRLHDDESAPARAALSTRTVVSERPDSPSSLQHDFDHQPRPERYIPKTLESFDEE